MSGSEMAKRMFSDSGEGGSCGVLEEEGEEEEGSPMTGGV